MYGGTILLESLMGAALMRAAVKLAKPLRYQVFDKVSFLKQSIRWLAGETDQVHRSNLKSFRINGSNYFLCFLQQTTENSCILQ